MPGDSREVLGQMVHEISSPLSSLWMRFAESPTDPATASAVERLRQLLAYGVTTLLVPPVATEPASVRQWINAALDLLGRSAALRGPQLGEFRDGRALLPADDRSTEALFCGVLEAATYGAAEAAVGIRTWETSGAIWVTVSSASEMSRDPEMLGERLAVVAAARLAWLCGGRLMVSASRPRATLILRAARFEEKP